MDLLSNLSPSQASKPSVFELIAQEKLNALLSPALRYILATYAARYPRYLLRVLQYHDELFVVLMLIVQRHYLRVNKGSFAETFYGLKRARSEKHNRSSDLTPQNVRQSLFALVVAPYLKSKLDEAYAELLTEQGGGFLAEDDDDDEAGSDLDETLDGSPPSRTFRRQRWFKKMFVKVYPYVHLGYTSAHLAYQILYMFGLSRYYTPYLHWMGVEVKRLTPTDMRMIQRESSRPRTNPLAQGAHVALEFLKVSLPLSIFFYKFVDWFFTTDYAKQSKSTFKLPPPPAPVPPHPDGVGLPKSRSMCPVCKRAIVNPTALPTGYVYCYPCVFRVVDETGACPVTLRAVKLEQLRRIFQSDV
ncbi:Pex12 amino terminal region-domain-containing protein [Catenaria anguillulae PL171]|uniref:Peroxisome assembly protein 12 n=1 Tax=Catenaria anguillulae PL171 TaxID=765915 RepID=A0A1Y2HH04_9FUNG|nr:Pex12 amino terminal region-domain-containing protein [Catenaria anguillulae PL171]